MTLVDAEDILRGMKALLDGENALPDTEEFPRYRIGLDLAINHCWRSEWWPELMRGQFRYFRANWLAASTYDKTDEVYDSATQQYFQSLRNGTTGAGNSPTVGGVEQSSLWAVCRTTYAGSNWVSGTAYAVGQKVFYPVTNQFYQCHTAHTSSGTLVPDATGGNERWGVLTPFDRYVSKTQPAQTGSGAAETVIGDCFDVKDNNPKVNARWQTLAWDNSENGIQVLEDAIRVFVQFRIPRPRLKGNLFDATLTYAVGNQVYWDNDGTIIGNFYDCIDATTAGEDPTDTPAKWQVVQIPEWFYPALVHMGVAKMYMADGQADKMGAPMELADSNLNDETGVIYRQQGKSPPIPMRTY